SRIAIRSTSVISLKSAPLELLLVGRHGEVLARDLCSLLSEIVGSSQIAAEEAHLAVYIALQKRLPIRASEMAMNRDGCGAGNGGNLAGPLAAGLEAAHGAVKYNDVRDAGGVAIAVAIDVLEFPFFLKLMDQVFVERNLEFGRQLDLVRLNHFHLDRRSLDLCGLVFLGQQRRGSECQSIHTQADRLA